LVNATWWQDWTSWIAQRGGEMIPAPARPGSDEFPPIENAPGSYVFATSGDK
jgi:polyhydroxyalkanoate synthase